MSAPGQLFFGQKTYTLDSKNRVVVQGAWRPKDGSEVILVHCMSRGRPMFKVVSPDRFAHHLALIQASTAMSEAQKDDKRRNLGARCYAAHINEQGKMLLSREVCEKLYLKPEMEVLQIGCIHYFELWNKADFDDATQLDFSAETTQPQPFEAVDDVGGAF